MIILTVGSLLISLLSLNPMVTPLIILTDPTLNVELSEEKLIQHKNLKKYLLFLFMEIVMSHSEEELLMDMSLGKPALDLWRLILLHKAGTNRNFILPHGVQRIQTKLKIIIILKKLSCHQEPLYKLYLHIQKLNKSLSLDIQWV